MSTYTKQEEQPFEQLLAGTVEAVKAAGGVLLDRFDPSARPQDKDRLLQAIRGNDEASEAVLRPLLAVVRPQAQWVENEEEGGPLPAGEWWVVDAAEGNVNHIHGMADWGVTATLVRESTPVLTAVYLPLANTLYTAVAGGGAFQDGTRLQASQKPALDAALVGTGQARPGEDETTLQRMGASITAMLGSALLVRAAVPATLTLVQVAAGRMDAFWQYSQVRSGLAAGALLTVEAGGAVTDMAGHPWTFDSKGFLAAGPNLHRGILRVLAGNR